MATLIFIPGRGSVSSTAQEWKSGSIHWLSVYKLLSRAGLNSVDLEQSDLGPHCLPLY